MRFRSGAACAAVLLAFTAGSAAAQADSAARGVRIGLRYDPGSKPGVLVLPIPGPTGDSIRVIIERDFDFSDRITQIPLSNDEGSILAAGNSTGGLNYGVFATLGAAGVLQITLTPRGLHVVLHDVAKQGVATVREFALPKGDYTRDWRQAVHSVSDVAQEWMTGERGASQTRVVFMRNHALYTIDPDGFGETPIPVVGEALSPNWHPSGNWIAYATFGPGSRIAIYDLKTGKTREFGAAPNVSNISPVFSPDGKSIVWSISGENGADLYTSPWEGDIAPRKITVGRGTRSQSPSFSPDGRRIAFGSDRSGHPEVYIMDADGTNVMWFTSLDFGDQADRNNPDWSPDGRQIAFQSLIDGRYQIFVMSLRDRQPRQLTSEGVNEEPSWSPDGRHIVFVSTRSGTKQLWVLDVESARLRQLTQAGGSRVPAWSPRLTTK